MTDREFLAISEVYRLLSQFDARELAAASRRPGLSAHLRSALAELSVEGASNKVRRGSAISPSRPAPPPSAPPSEYKNGLLRFLMDPKRFPDKHALMRLAAQAQIPLKIDARMSRERVAKQIANRVAGNAALRESLARVPVTADDAQTEGWLNLILKPR